MNASATSNNSVIDDECVPTVRWPELNPAALQGVAGEILALVAPHTEADPAAVLLELLTVFGAAVGPGPYVRAGNAEHHCVIHALVVGRTSDGAKGTGLSVVMSIIKEADMGLVVNSGLSTAEGLIEAVRDGTPADESDEDNFDPGVTDKRLLVLETEYRQVLSRSRRDGNTLAPTLRQAWDGGVLRTMTRSRSRLTATDPHIAIIGHITPGEFRAELRDSDLSGGSVNRMLMCLSRRTKLLPNLGNVPAETITKAAADLSSARKAASERQAVEFANQTVWARWEEIYRRLNRDRPESRATDATARSVSQVLRLALVYALLDGAEAIGLEHLNAADALWKYCEHSAKWLFSTYALEQAEDDHRKLVKFIEEGGPNGRTRTEISTGYFQGHRKSEDINRALAPLIHNGHVVEEESDSPAGGRKTTRYVHQKWRNTRNGETGRSQQ